MKTIIYIGILISLLLSCSASKNNSKSTEKPVTTKSDTIRIANDELEYEVVIVDPGFSTWLSSRAYPRSYHSESYLENKNYIYVSEWNRRVLLPHQYAPDLYEMSINYDPTIHYGFEVNYLIYNYMIYFQNTYKQKLDGYVPPK